MGEDTTEEEHTPELTEAIINIGNNNDNQPIPIVSCFLYQNNIFLTQAIKKLTDAIASSERQVTLDFSSSQLYDFEKEGFGISWISGLAQKIIEALVESLKNKKTGTNLHIIKDKISTEDIKALLDYSLGQDTKLKLTIKQGPVTQHLLKELKELIQNHDSSLTLDLSDSRIQQKAFSTLANAIKRIKHPTKIVVSKNLPASYLKTLNEAIKEASAPLYIDLSSKSPDTAILSHSIKHSKFPRCFDLSSNNIDAVGVSHIADAIANAKAPLTIYLNAQEITEVSALELIKALKSSQVPVRIKLAYDLIEETTRENLASILSSQNKMHFAKRKPCV